MATLLCALLSFDSAQTLSAFSPQVRNCLTHRRAVSTSVTDTATYIESGISLDGVRILAEDPSTTAEAFETGILGLKSAVDAVRALDLDTELVTPGAYAATLEVIARRAPNAAAGALVGHTMARLKKRPDGSAMCMKDELLSPLAAALLKARKNQEALTAVDSLSAERSVRDYRVGILAASRLNDATKVKMIVQEAILDTKKDETKGVAGLDEATLKFGMKVLAKSGDYRTPFAIVDSLPRERRSPALYHAAITACGKARPHPKGKTAMLLWKRLKADGFRDAIPRATYNALLHCAQGAHDEKEGDHANANATTAILAEMAARQISLDVVSYNIALNSLAARGRFNEMLDLLEKMESSKISPTEVTFSTVIYGAAKANNSIAAFQLLRAHVKYCPVKPGDAAFGAALEACLRDPDAAQGAASAKEVVAIMCDVAASPERRERIEQLARDALHRGIIDPERVDKAEAILGMALHNRQAAV